MEENKPKVTVEQVNAAVAQAGDIPQPKQPTKKQLEKQQKQINAYWRGMISRAEAVEMVNEALRNEQEKNRLLFIQLKTITELLVQKGLTTMEELDNLSRPIVDSIYGKPAELKEQDAKKEEAIDPDKEPRKAADHQNPYRNVPEE